MLIYLISRRYFAQDRNSMIFFYYIFFCQIFFAVPCYGVLVHSPRVTILLLSVIILFYFFFLQPRSVSYTLWLDFDCASIIGFRLAECCKKKLPNIKFLPSRYSFRWLVTVLISPFPLVDKLVQCKRFSQNSVLFMYFL